MNSKLLDFNLTSELTPLQFRVFWYVIGFATKNNWLFNVSATKACGLCQMSDKSFKSAIKVLVQLNYLRLSSWFPGRKICLEVTDKSLNELGLSRNSIDLQQSLDLSLAGNECKIGKKPFYPDGPWKKGDSLSPEFREYLVTRFVRSVYPYNSVPALVERELESIVEQELEQDSYLYITYYQSFLRDKAKTPVFSGGFATWRKRSKETSHEPFYASDFEGQRTRQTAAHTC